jgi:D-glycero-alpha-D-manno-heptose-7-phosphate kinase
VWKGEHAGPRKLAEEAVYLEREVLHEPAGYQDQYIAAFGGLKYMEFGRDGTVGVEPVVLSAEGKQKLKEHLLLLYTGKERSASGILGSQAAEAGNHTEIYDEMRDMAGAMFRDLNSGKWEATGDYLHRNWLLKKTLNPNISDPVIDGWYAKGLAAGASGGKLIGAGGGGFMLFFAPPEKHNAIKTALPDLKETKFEFAQFGSEIRYTGD